MVALAIVHAIEAEAVVEEGLGEGEVVRLEAAPFAFVGTIEQVVVIIENACVVEGLVFVGVEMGVLAADDVGSAGVFGTGDDAVHVAGVGRHADESGEGNAADAAVPGAEGTHFAETVVIICLGFGEVTGGDSGVLADAPVSVAIIHAEGAGGGAAGVEDGNGIAIDIAVAAHDDVGGIEGFIRILKVLLIAVWISGIVAPRGDGIVGFLSHGGEPGSNQVDGGEAAGAVAEDVALFEIRTQGGHHTVLLEEGRFKFRGGVDAIVAVEGGFLAELGLIGDTGKAERKFVFEDDLIDIEGGAVAVVVVDAQFEFALGLEAGGVGAVIDDTSGGTHAEEDGVGAALDVDAADIVTIPRDVGEEEVAGVVGAFQSAHAGIIIRAEQIAVFVNFAAVAHAGEVAAYAADLGADGVFQEGFDIGGADVLEELLGDDGDSGTDVFEVCADASACEGGVRLVAVGVLVGGDDEGRERDGLLVFAVGGSRFNLRWSCLLSHRGHCRHGKSEAISEHVFRCPFGGHY